MLFEERWCERCKRDQAFREGYARGENVGAEESCPILANATCFDIGDPLYPSEWIEDDDGPRCTAFEPVDGAYRCERTLDLFALPMTRANRRCP